MFPLKNLAREGLIKKLFSILQLRRYASHDKDEWGNVQ